MAISVITSAANLADDAVTIPLSTLNSFGLASGEYANTAVGVQRAIFSALKAIQAESFAGVVGLTKPANVAQATAGVNVLNSTFSLTETLVGNLSTTPNTLGVIPLPSTGTNNGVGGLALGDIFAGVDVQASGTSVTNQLVIPTEDLAFYGAVLTPSTDVASGADNRKIIASLFYFLASDSSVSVRTASVQSAITARSVSVPAIGTLPVNALAATNPTTGLDSADRLIAIASTMTVTFQQVVNQATETVDVNFVTA